MRLILLLLSISVIYYAIQQQKMKKPVVIVGSGLAGLTSAHHLLKHRIPVVLLEKGDKFGGNSMKASSGINGIHSTTQKMQGIVDSFDLFVGDTMKSGKGIGNAELQRVLVNESTDALEWLQREIGVSLDVVNRLGGHSQSRTHRSEGIPPGYEIVSKVMASMKKQEGLELKFESKLVGLDVMNNNVKGVHYVDLETGDERYLSTNHVVMATGGFGHSKELLQKYKPELLELPTTNDRNTQGEGQILLEQIGGELIDMEHVQIHPTGFIKQDDPENNWKFLAAESLRGVGGILLNSELKRFVNELDTRDVVSQAILKQKGKKAYLVLNKDMYQDFKFQIDFYTKMKLFEKITLHEKFGNDAEKVVKVLEDYSQSDDDAFGREFKEHVFSNITSDIPLFIGEVTPVVHFTMGGVKIDINGSVLNKEGDVIQGLFAAGEVSGGVHGLNRLGGNSLLECVVFGTRAAKKIEEDY
jgi:FAD-dependent fumarate reductase